MRTISYAELKLPRKRKLPWSSLWFQMSTREPAIDRRRVCRPPKGPPGPTGAPNGPQHASPGQSEAAQPRSAALGSQTPLRSSAPKGTAQTSDIVPSFRRSSQFAMGCQWGLTNRGIYCLRDLLPAGFGTDEDARNVPGVAAPFSTNRIQWCQMSIRETRFFCGSSW